MHRVSGFLVSALLLALLQPTLAQAPSTAVPRSVVAEPSVASAGEKITLKWYFTGKKVLVSGGRFGKGKVVTGQTKLTDTPRQTTRYVFDVWYRADAPLDKSGKRGMKDLHARYAVQVEVPNLATFRSARGWQIQYLKDWKRDHLKTPDGDQDGLIYFQKADDSVERLAVAVMPSQGMSCSGLMDKICADMPERYQELKMDEPKLVQHEEIPAVWTSFSGVAQSHPDVRTQSMLMAFVANGKGYVISVRTAANGFSDRKPLLEKMMRSFHLSASPVRSAHL